MFEGADGKVSLAELFGDKTQLAIRHFMLGGPEHDGCVSRRALEAAVVCAHPAIDARVHTPLMLQVVLGLEAADIAAAFVTPASTMGQRLTRAKHKIRDARSRSTFLVARS
jgi:predicted dithiol-disulfide oxidoreductase (DUF899 family)